MRESDNIYNNYTENYSFGNPRLLIYHEYRISSFIKELEKSFDLNKINVIDFGSGDGHLSPYFNNYTGIDSSDQMIKLSKNKYPKKKFIKGSLRELEKECSLNKFDLIISLNTLPYLDPNETDIFFKIVSKNGSDLFISHANELLDLVTLNRYTIEHREHLIKKFDLNLKKEVQEFRELITYSNLPEPIPQTKQRFGSTLLNVSERDTLKKYRVDPFSWPKKVANNFSFTVKNVIPLRLFILPPIIMERDDKMYNMLHSNAFDKLPMTYKLIMCSQFRVFFKNNEKDK